MKTPARTSAALLLAAVLGTAIAQQPPPAIPGLPGGPGGGLPLGPGAGHPGDSGAGLPGAGAPTKPKRGSLNPGAATGLPGKPAPVGGAGTNYGGGPAGASPGAPAPARTGPDIIREAKLKVLQQHYEKTFQECIQLEKDLLLATPEERPKIEATARALKSFLAMLEAELLPLTGKPAPRKTTVPGLSVPGLDSDSSGGAGSSPPPTAPGLNPAPVAPEAAGGLGTTTPAIPGLDVIPAPAGGAPRKTVPPAIPGAGSPPAIPGLDTIPPPRQ